MQRNERGHFVKGHNTPLSEETKLKISISSKGKNTWSKGRKVSDEIRKRMSVNNARYWTGKKRPPISEYHKQRITETLTGSKRTEETKAKMRASSRTRGLFGLEHPCWVDVKRHPIHKSIRDTFKYRQWRTDIFKRDNYTCVLCNVNNCYIEADHYPVRFIDIIKEFNVNTIDESFNCEKLWDLTNGRTLCKKCHHKHTFGKELQNK